MLRGDAEIFIGKFAIVKHRNEINFRTGAVQSVAKAAAYTKETKVPILSGDNPANQPITPIGIKSTACL